MNIGSRGIAALRVRLAGVAFGLLLACGATQAHAIAIGTGSGSTAYFTEPTSIPIPFSSIAFVPLNQPVTYKIQYNFVAPDGMEFESASGTIDWDSINTSAVENFAVPAQSGLIALTHTYTVAQASSIVADLAVNWILSPIAAGVRVSVEPVTTEHVQAYLLAIPVATPIPSAVLMFGTALAGLGLIGWRRRSTFAGSAV
jgi:hypothetical protein